MRLVFWGGERGAQDRRSLHLPARIFKVHMGVLMRFIHIYYPDGFNHTILFLAVGMAGGTDSPRTGEGARSL